MDPWWRSINIHDHQCWGLRLHTHIIILCRYECDLSPSCSLQLHITLDYSAWIISFIVFRLNLHSRLKIEAESHSHWSKISWKISAKQKVFRFCTEVVHVSFLHVLLSCSFTTAWRTLTIRLWTWTGSDWNDVASGSIPQTERLIRDWEYANLSVNVWHLNLINCWMAHSSRQSSHLFKVPIDVLWRCQRLFQTPQQSRMLLPIHSSTCYDQIQVGCLCYLK